MDAQQSVAELMRLINGFQISQCIHVAAALGVADLLKDGPRPSGEIAAATGTHAGAMYRLLHALASVGVLAEQADGRFALTSVGECLRSDAPQSRAAWARLVGRPYSWQSWGAMRHSVTTGENAFRHVHGAGIWDWRAERPEEAAFFDAAMTEQAHSTVDAIAGAGDFSRFGCIADVGGGHGALLAGILARHPGTRGILFDLPHVVAGAPAVLAAHGVAERCQVVGGSMFDTIPQGGDAYVIKSVLMDEDDVQARSILRACRSAMAPSGRLIVIERLMAEPNQPGVILSDIMMLVMTGGRDRTLAEFSALFAATGFQLEQSIVATGSPYSLLVGAPV